MQKNAEYQERKLLRNIVNTADITNSNSCGICEEQLLYFENARYLEKNLLEML